MSKRVHHEWCAYPEVTRNKCPQCDELYRRFPRNMSSSDYKRVHHSTDPQFLGENTWFYDGVDGVHIMHEVTEDENFNNHRPVEITISWTVLRDALRRNAMPV